MLMPKKTKTRKEEKTRREKKSVEIKELPLEIPRELFERFIKDVERRAFKVLTPYTLAQQYDIKISLARKMLRLAAQYGFIKLYSGGRTPIYVIS